MRTGSVGLASVIAAASPALAAPPACDGMMPDPTAAHGPARAITALDLVRLRDIGYSSMAPGKKLISLSPDGKQVAFPLWRADAVSNHYCVAMLVMALRPGAVPRIVDEGDEIIIESFPIRGVKVDYGSPALTVPSWSPDGQWLAFLKRKDGSNQVWRVPLSGGPAEMVTHSTVGVDHFAWSDDGRAIIVADRPDLLTAEAEIDREGLSGYRYDDRIVPYSASKPAIKLPLPFRFAVVDLGNGRDSCRDGSGKIPYRSSGI